MEKEDEINVFEAFEDLYSEIEDLIEENKQLITKNEELQDEVDSLWVMMDEIAESDIKNFSHILKEIKTDAITRALMVSKKMVDC